MSRNRAFLAAGLVCGLVVYAAGCALPVIEGVKAVHSVLEGEYETITPLAREALVKYKGYQVGTLVYRPVTLPEDTKEENRAQAQKDLNREIEFAQGVVAILPDRFNEYLVDNAGLRLNTQPALTVSVRDIRVTLRKGFMSVALPKAWVESIVTLSDAKTGAALGEAKVYGSTTSRILGSPRHLGNFISRGTAKWITETREPPGEK